MTMELPPMQMTQCVGNVGSHIAQNMHIMPCVKIERQSGHFIAVTSHTWPKHACHSEKKNVRTDHILDVPSQPVEVRIDDPHQLLMLLVGGDLQVVPELLHLHTCLVLPQRSCTTEFEEHKLVSIVNPSSTESTPNCSIAKPTSHGALIVRRIGPIPSHD